MLFSSAAFLYSFLPLTIAVYFLMPRRLKNAALLLMSLIFYAWGEPRYAILMLLSVTQGYIFARLIGKSRGTKKAKAYLIISLVLSLGMLGVFKYANFFAESFAAVFGLKIAALNIALPIGISFYTFQLISYVIDVYRADVEPQRDYVAFAAYISMFPQLIAGPIVRYSDIEAELTARAYGADKAAYGARRFILGLGKKVLIANVLAELVNAFKASGEKSTLFYWVYAAAYMLHVYFDIRLHVPRKLQLSLYCRKHNRILAQMAYVAKLLVQGLCIYPPWRQPREKAARAFEHCNSMDAYGPMARGGLELRHVGDNVRGAADRGKNAAFRLYQKSQSNRAYIHAVFRYAVLHHV